MRGEREKDNAHLHTMSCKNKKLIADQSSARDRRAARIAKIIIMKYKGKKY